MINVGPSFLLPANSSRFFSDCATALNQPLGHLQLAWNELDPFVVNSEYRSELIKYDEQYCTAVSAIGITYLIPTLTYIENVLGMLPEGCSVVDIGCGQGELVEKLRASGVNASGFDPVLRTESTHLHPRYWSSKDLPADLYVMRCVLPHIAKPWDFLASISDSSPGSLVLIEFQRLEWIIENSIWYQISHDHVNLFSIEDFSGRYDVVSSGTFSNGEWGWVLVNPSSKRIHNPKSLSVSPISIASLFEEKNRFLQVASELGREIVIWGAAGKGIVLAHALGNVNCRISAIDADPHRWNLFLEASGVEVLSPDRGLEETVRDSLILVCNPNHLQQIEQLVAGRFEVCLPHELV